MSSNTTRIAKNTLMLYFRQILIMLVSLYTVRIAQVLNTSVECLMSGNVRDDKKVSDEFYRRLPEMAKHLEAMMEAVKVLQ